MSSPSPTSSTASRSRSKASLPLPPSSSSSSLAGPWLSSFSSPRTSWAAGSSSFATMASRPPSMCRLLSSRHQNPGRLLSPRPSSELLSALESGGDSLKRLMSEAMVPPPRPPEWWVWSRSSSLLLPLASSFVAAGTAGVRFSSPSLRKEETPFLDRRGSPTENDEDDVVVKALTAGFARPGSRTTSALQLEPATWVLHTHIWAVIF